MRLQQLLQLDRRMTALLMVAMALLAANLARFGTRSIHELEQQMAMRRQMLEQYRKTAAAQNTLAREVSLLREQRERLASRLFRGRSQEELASMIQITLQDLVVKSGLEPEFLQPSRKDSSQAPGGVTTMAVKLRLSGTIIDFARFLEEIAVAEKLFTIESFTLKPTKKNDELKIFLEVRGYGLTEEKP